VTTNDDDGLLVETADYYIEDTEYSTYVQFNAWEMDRYTETNSATVQYDFVFDDEDRDDVTFTINIERE